MRESVFEVLLKKNREERQPQHFSGTLLDYLCIVQKNPQVAMLAHQRLYTLLTGPGVEYVNTAEHPRLKRIYGQHILKRYPFFTKDFFGLDRSLAQIVRYFYAAAMHGEEARQILFLVGPAGSGKSSLMAALKQALETSPPIYALEGCPVQEEPLHLIPGHLRFQLEKELRVKIEGELCPVCRHRLMQEYGGEYERFPVISLNFSVRERKGIGVVPPIDAHNRDTSVLIGSVDISKMDLYGEDDPRILSLNGALNVGNRGMVEFIEVFKNDGEYLHALLTATQEKTVPSPGKGDMLYFDGAILAHSNEGEWRKFKADHKNEAILDRIVKVEVPYCLELTEEVKIYRKMLGRSNFCAHIAPYTIELAAMYAVLTRLATSSAVEPLIKLKIYNGEEIVSDGSEKPPDIFSLREEAPREGMTGVSTRFIMKTLDTALSESETGCIDPPAIMDVLVKATKELAVTAEEKMHYLGFLQDTLKKEYHKILEKEITRAFIAGYAEQAESLFTHYLNHAEAYINHTKIKDKHTGEESAPDLTFLQSIEEHIGISGCAARRFRQDVAARMFSVLRNGGRITLGSHAPLQAAIEEKLTASVREIARVVLKAKVRDEEQADKYAAMVEGMRHYGYCRQCADVLLKYAAHNLWITETPAGKTRDAAIFQPREKFFDAEKCIDCGACAKFCPAGAIEIVE